MFLLKGYKWVKTIVLKKNKEDEAIKYLEEELGGLLFTLVCMANAENVDLTQAYERKMDKVLKRDNERWGRKDGK